MIKLVVHKKKRDDGKRSLRIDTVQESKVVVGEVPEDSL